MNLTITPLGPNFFAEVLGFDLGKPVPPAVFSELDAAFNRYGVLVFPGQPIDDEQQIAFSQLFGPLETNPTFTTKARRLKAEVADISNVDAEGRIFPADDPRRVFNLANQLWHTDSSYRHVPAKCSLLSARQLPPDKGETEFADMRAAYDALPADRKRALEGLQVEHSIFRSRAQIGFGEFNEAIAAQLPPVRQLLIRRHAGSGRKSLYLASHASHIIGMPVEEGRKLLEELIAFATQPQFVYQHRWRVGDLVMWDNRCTMHRSRPYDESYKRELHRTTVSDSANSIEQEMAA